MVFLEEEMGKDLMKVIDSAALDSKEHSYFFNYRFIIEEARE